MAIEFAAWETPFSNGRPLLVGVSHCAVKKFTLSDGREFVSPGKLSEMSVSVLILEEDTELFYEVLFDHVGAYRMMDEGGLLELWKASSKGGRPAISSFRVRGHSWCHESPVPFHMHTHDGWAYVIATDDECIEVLTPEPPSVEKIITPEI